MRIPSFHRATSFALLTLLTIATPTLTAQTAYKYRDANGQWVFTDRQPPPQANTDTFKLLHETARPHVAVLREDAADNSSRLIAVNDCLCTVTVKLTIVHSNIPKIADGTEFNGTLGPSTRQPLVQIARQSQQNPELQYFYRVDVGAPDAVHAPERPYRVPFAIGSTFPISQAFPSKLSHHSADSWYAVDIALPDGSPVFAARDGLVIDARHDSFRGSPSPQMLDQANVIEILHRDGTVAVYAHLHWDSIRVRIGDHVARGQYIASSGNTGFSSGPHLHFAVIRNNAGSDESVPVEFEGLGGTAITPVTHMALTAY